MSERAEWLAWRKQGIGASDVAGILGLSNWSSPWKVWAEKVGLLASDDAMSDRQQMGLDFEPVLAKMFTRETDLLVGGEQTWCRNDVSPWAQCTVDGFAFESDEFVTLAAAIGGFEAKTDGRFGWPDGVPANYQAQAQWGMFVTGLPKWYFAVLHAQFRFAVYELGRDQKDIDFMVARVSAFWTDHVLTGEPPEVDGSDATLAALAAVYPDHQPGVRADIATVADEVERWQRLGEQSRNIKKMADDAKAKVIAAVGDAELGCVDGAPIVSLRQQDGRKTTCAECGHVEQGNPFRVLRLASKKDQKETAA